MIILGINFSHDCSVAIIKDGKILAAIEEEKTSRIKQQFGWPHTAITTLLGQYDIQRADVDIVAFGSDFFNELSACEIQYRFDRSRSSRNNELISRIAAYYGFIKRKFGVVNKDVFREHLRIMGFTKALVTFYNHHLSHAASAYYCSPFVPDMIITCDGQGDGESFNFYRFDATSGIVPLVINSHQVSVGQFYSAITKILGFRPTRHEGKITGLAAYGKPTSLVQAFATLFNRDANANLTRFPGNELSFYWSKYNISSQLTLKQKINLKTSESETGLDYAKRFIILLHHLTGLVEGFSKEDIAFACQKVTEQIIVEETKIVLKKHFSSKIKLALAGGVFANVRVNQTLFQLDEIENVFVQPAMGDSGLAIGAAILADIEFNKRPLNTKQYILTDTYLGPNYSKEIESFMNTIRQEAVVVKMSHPAKEIAKSLSGNLVIGFWHGRMEWGPRALGNRTMMLNTFDRSVNDSLNERLSRTEFMPFAPSIIDHMIKEYIPDYDENCPAADYMTITYNVAPQYHNVLQAVVHVDGTARPQIVKRETNSYYYDIIDEFYKLTGCGAVVNTSFNAHEEPIVSTPAAAYRALKDGRIDVLVIEDYYILMR